MTVVTFQEFSKVDLRVGTIVSAQPFPEARKPALKLKIDFGTLGVKTSSAQVTANYQPYELIGRQVTAVVNFPPKQIGPFMSECLVLGAIDNQKILLLKPLEPVIPGSVVG